MDISLEESVCILPIQVCLNLDNARAVPMPAEMSREGGGGGAKVKPHHAPLTDPRISKA